MKGVVYNTVFTWKKTVSLIFVCLTFLSILFTAPAMAETTGVYNTKAVNLRPSIDSNSSLGLAQNGTTCVILGDGVGNGGKKWYRVRITSHTNNGGVDLYGKTGWSVASYITVNGGGGGSSGGDSSGDSGSGTAKNGHIELNSGFVYIRSKPGTHGSKIGQLYDGDPVVYIDQKLNSTGTDGNKWYKITSPVIGYVAAQYVNEGSGSSGGSSGNIPVCSQCGSKMEADQYISHTYNAADSHMCVVGGSYRIWYRAYATYTYCCLNHPSITSSGPQVKGHVFSDETDTFRWGDGPSS